MCSSAVCERDLLKVIFVYINLGNCHVEVVQRDRVWRYGCGRIVLCSRTYATLSGLLNFNSCFTTSLNYRSTILLSKIDLNYEYKIWPSGPEVSNLSLHWDQRWLYSIQSRYTLLEATTFFQCCSHFLKKQFWISYFE